MCLCFPACLFPAFRHFFVKMTASFLLWMTEWRLVQLLHISSAAKRCKQNSYHQSQTFTNLRPDLFGRVNAYWVVQSPSGVFFLQQTYFPEMNFNCKFTAGFNQWNVYISTQYTSRARSSAYCEKQKKLCLTWIRQSIESLSSSFTPVVPTWHTLLLLLICWILPPASELPLVHFLMKHYTCRGKSCLWKLSNPYVSKCLVCCLP